MLGRTPGNIVAIRAWGSVIADFDVTEKMLHYFISRCTGVARWCVRIVVGVPSGITQVEKRAVRDSAMQTGAREVCLIEAHGRGHRRRLADQEPGGNMIVDHGAPRLPSSPVRHRLKSVPVTRWTGDRAVHQTYNLLVGERRAERSQDGPRSGLSDGRRAADDGGQGRDPRRIPKTIVITDEEIRGASRT
jgi:rod shape-determining protein MreB